MFVKQVTIGKRVSVTFLALLEFSVGAVREISRIALWQCQCLFTMQWIYVMYTTKKYMWCFHWNAWAVDKKILRESLYRSILYRSSLFWNQACHGGWGSGMGVGSCGVQAISSWRHVGGWVPIHLFKWISCGFSRRFTVPIFFWSVLIWCVHCKLHCSVCRSLRQWCPCPVSNLAIVLWASKSENDFLALDCAST